MPTISQTLQPGQTILGPFPVGNNTRADVSIDRNQPGGLNTIPTGTSVDIGIEWTSDPGANANWHKTGGARWDSGIIISNRTGQQLNTDTLVVKEVDPSATRIRLPVTVTGQAVTLAGTVTVS